MNLKFVLLLILFGLNIPLFAQNGSSKKSKNKGNPFLADEPLKWIMGLKTGVNKSNVSIIERYSVFSSLDNTSEEMNNKLYDKKNKYSPQIALITTFLPIKNLGVSLQPAFFSYKYGYSNEYNWTGEATSGLDYQLKYSHKHTLNYLDLPLYIKYYIIDSEVHAFIQGGGFYGKLLNAKKKVETTGIDSPGENQFVSTNETQHFDVNESYIKTYTGLVAGGGVGFRMDNFRIALEVNYRKGLNNITNEKNRYSNNRLVSSFYDNPDDIKFTNWEISLSCSLPLDNLVHVAKKSDKPIGRKKH